MKLRRGLLLLVIGCSSPLTIAQLRDAGDGERGDAPSFGDASSSDAKVLVDDPPEDAGHDG